MKGILMKCVIRHKNKMICNECFNALSTQERMGKGARPVGWIPNDTPQVKCDQCNDWCVKLSEEVENER